ncbi:hypothetical protein [Bradyrhizobium sp. CCBAU 53380]|uniref:hypothetical protein n=1 Tax=Bradyrhizobium sp. CCBAU 53380 TaxID=1325117 RepID=UPI00230411BF|nr:hypothetical protein [Bradyrhizobium sp. CCBAU 53380]MDA9423099.1 hypothetical protein [Bradyrhizobium sp. CCBAU 53380]
MPKHYKLSVHRPVPTWSEIWRSFYMELEQQAVPILRAAGFYEVRDIDPRVAPDQKLGDDEKEALERIAAALTIAANCAHRTPRAVIGAWLTAIGKRPTLFRSRDLPPEALEAIAAHYRRGAERPGTFLQDVLGHRSIRFPEKKRRPATRRIALAARAAAGALPRHRGRPQNIGNWLAAEYLSSAYRYIGGRKVLRHQTTTDLGSKVVVYDDGLFYRFLELVIGPLQKHLKTHGLPAVTIETIERIACEHFR